MNSKCQPSDNFLFEHFFKKVWNIISPNHAKIIFIQRGKVLILSCNIPFIYESVELFI